MLPGGARACRLSTEDRGSPDQRGIYGRSRSARDVHAQQLARAAADIAGDDLGNAGRCHDAAPLWPCCWPVMCMSRLRLPVRGKRGIVASALDIFSKCSPCALSALRRPSWGWGVPGSFPGMLARRPALAGRRE